MLQYTLCKTQQREFIEKHQHAFRLCEDLVVDAIKQFQEVYRMIHYDHNASLSFPDILNQLTEKGYASRCTPDSLEILKKDFEKHCRKRLQVGSMGRFRSIDSMGAGLDGFFFPDHVEDPGFVGVYGNLRFGDYGKNVLEEEMSSFIIDTTLGTETRKMIDFTKLVRVGIHLESCDWMQQAFRLHDVEERNRIGSSYPIDDTHGTMVGFEFHTTLLRFMMTSEFALDEEMFCDRIRNVIFNKLIALKYATGYFMRWCSHQEDIMGGKLESIVKLAFIISILNHSVNGTLGDSLGESLDRLMNDFRYSLQGSNLQNSVLQTANLWMGRLIKGNYEIPTMGDRALQWILELYNKSKTRVLFANRINRPVHPVGIFRGIRMVGTESIDIRDHIRAEFAFESIREEDLYDSAVYSFPGMENISPEKMQKMLSLTRAKLLSKIPNKERQRYINLENDFMKIKIDALNCNSIDAQKIALNRLTSLGKLIQIQIDSTKNDDLISLLGYLDSERYVLMERISDRSILRERQTMLYGMIDTNDVVKL